MGEFWQLINEWHPVSSVIFKFLTVFELQDYTSHSNITDIYYVYILTSESFFGIFTKKKSYFLHKK